MYNVCMTGLDCVTYYFNVSDFAHVVLYWLGHVFLAVLCKYSIIDPFSIFWKVSGGVLISTYQEGLSHFVSLNRNGHHHCDA